MLWLETYPPGRRRPPTYWADGLPHRWAKADDWSALWYMALPLSPPRRLRKGMGWPSQTGPWGAEDPEEADLGRGKEFSLPLQLQALLPKREERGQGRMPSCGGPRERFWLSRSFPLGQPRNFCQGGSLLQS